MAPAVRKSLILSSTLGLIRGNRLAPPSPLDPMEETVYTPEWDENHEQAQYHQYEEEDPYQVFILRRPHERSSTVSPLLVKQPEMAETRLRFVRNYEEESNISRIPCPFEFPTRPSMLETLTDDEDSFSTISRQHMGRRSFSLPSVSSAANIEPPQIQARGRSRTDVARNNESSPRKGRSRKNASKNADDDGSKARRRNTMPAKRPGDGTPSMAGYPPNAKPPRRHAAGASAPKPPVYPPSPSEENATRLESAARRAHSHHASTTPPQFATVSQLGGRKISAPAIYRKRKDGSASNAPFALLVESPTRASPRRPPVPGAPSPISPRPVSPPVPRPVSPPVARPASPLVARPASPPIARPASPTVARPASPTVARPATSPTATSRPVTPVPAWPPHPSEGWPPKEPPIAREASSSSRVCLREESAILSPTLSASQNEQLASPPPPERSVRKKKGKRKKRKRRPILYSSVRLRTYLRTARGRERAATGTATRARYNRNEGEGGGRELSIISSGGVPAQPLKNRNSVSGSGMRRVLNFLSFAQPSCTGGQRRR